MNISEAVLRSPGCPPSSPIREARRVDFESFAHLLVDHQAQALERAYCFGRFGRALPAPARNRVYLNRALTTLREHGIEPAMPGPLWGVPEGVVWSDDDTIAGLPCEVCGSLRPVSMPSDDGGAPYVLQCLEARRSFDQQDAHDAHDARVREERRKARKPRRSTR